MIAYGIVCLCLSVFVSLGLFVRSYITDSRLPSLISVSLSAVCLSHSHCVSASVSLSLLVSLSICLYLFIKQTLVIDFVCLIYSSVHFIIPFFLLPVRLFSLIVPCISNFTSSYIPSARFPRILMIDHYIFRFFLNFVSSFDLLSLLYPFGHIFSSLQLYVFFKFLYHTSLSHFCNNS